MKIVLNKAAVSNLKLLFWSTSINCKSNGTTYYHGTEGSGSGDSSGDIESSGDVESDGSGEANSTKDEIVGNIADLFGSLNPVMEVQSYFLSHLCICPGY